MIRNLVAAIAVPVAIAAAPSLAHADDKEQCVAASEQAQTLRDEGKLRQTRAQLLTCARDVCPGIVRKDCDKWLAEVDAAMPTVVLGARDPKGNDLSGTRVTLDGAPLADRLDGRPVAVDPGEHTFRYEAPGVGSTEQHVVIRVGEKNRSLTVVLAPVAKAAPAVAPPPEAPSSPPPPPAEERPANAGSSSAGVPAVTWLLGGVGVAAIGSFAYFGLTGRSDVDNLRSTCAPSCAQSDVDAAHTKLVIADVSLGVGILALGGALLTFLGRDSSPTPAVQAGVQPRSGGAVATFGARF